MNDVRLTAISPCKTGVVAAAGGRRRGADGNGRGPAMHTAFRSTQSAVALDVCGDVVGVGSFDTSMTSSANPESHKRRNPAWGQPRHGAV